MPGASSLKRKRLNKKKILSKQVLNPKLDTKEDFLEGELGTNEIPPRSFVLNDGHVSSSIRGLISDFKKIMAPNTAKNIKALPSAKVKDFTSLAGGLKVSHLLLFSQSEYKVFLKIARMPRGPTLKFQIMNFSLLKDILMSQKRPMMVIHAFKSAPVVVTNLKPDEGKRHMQLAAQMFLDMFPSINLQNDKISSFRRCVLINFKEDKQLFELAHYCIRRRPMGLSKCTKNLVSGRIVPDLGKFKDISEYFLKSEILSDSEVEENCKNQFEIKREHKNKVSIEKSAVRLHEIGPRLTMKLVSIQDGLCSGTVLYPSS